MKSTRCREQDQTHDSNSTKEENEHGKAQLTDNVTKINVSLCLKVSKMLFPQNQGHEQTAKCDHVPVVCGSWFRKLKNHK